MKIRIEKEVIADRKVSVKLHCSAKKAGLIVNKLVNEICSENGWSRKDCYISFRCGEKGRMFVKSAGYTAVCAIG